MKTIMWIGQQQQHICVYKRNVQQLLQCINITTMSTTKKHANVYLCKYTNSDTACEYHDRSHLISKWFFPIWLKEVFEVMRRGVWEREWWNVSCPARPSAVGSQIILDPDRAAVSSWTGAMWADPAILFCLVCVCVCEYVYMCVSLGCVHFQCHPRSKTWLMTPGGEEPLSQSPGQRSYKAGQCAW